MRYFISVVFSITSLCAFSQAQIDKWGGIHCPNGTSTLVTDLLKNRGASAIDFNASPSIPEVCTDGVREQINNMAESFKQEDQNNIQSLANSFCSHMSGWVEFVPGTCGAGGPPPICVANHWKQIGPYAAIDSLQKINKEKAIERANKMARLGNTICSCSVNEMQKQDNARLSNFNQPLSAYNAGLQAGQSSIKITCMGGCPPGYTCKDGYCEKDEATLGKMSLDYAKDKVKEYPKDKVKDYVKDKASEAIKERLRNITTVYSKYMGGFNFVAKYSTFFSTAVLGIINPDGGIPDVKVGSFVTGKMSGGNELYMNSLSKVSNSVDHLIELYNEIIRLNTGQNQVRDRNYIIDDISKERSALAYQLQLLEGYHREVTWTCKGCCDQMLNYQHTSAMNYANKILLVNIE